MPDTKEIHYLVGTDDEHAQHINATSQEKAVAKFVNGENEYGYDADEFDGCEVIVVAYSKVDTYSVDVIPPTDPELQIVKRTKIA